MHLHLGSFFNLEYVSHCKFANKMYDFKLNRRKYFIFLKNYDLKTKKNLCFQIAGKNVHFEDCTILPNALLCF
jgi:hypothetical protein